MSSRPISTDPCGTAPREGSGRVFRRAAAAWLDLRLRLRRAPLAVSTVALVLTLPLCLVCATSLDVPLARAALQAPPDLREVAEIFSDLGLSGYMLILSGLVAAGAIVALRRGRFPHRHPLLKIVAERALFVFAAVALSGLAVQVVKHVVGRARPGLLDQFGAFHFDHFSLEPDLASFPSGHSTSIFALAASIGLIVPRLRVPVFGLAVLVGLARMVLGAHYASDILAGAAFGVVVTLGVASVFADRSIAFTRARGVLRLKGRGMILSALRAEGCCSRPGA